VVDDDDGDDNDDGDDDDREKQCVQGTEFVFFVT
jgi:hypothetical protein